MASNSSGAALARRSKRISGTFKSPRRTCRPDAGAELVCEVYALGKQGCPPDGTGTDVVFRCDALTGFPGGPLVFILNISKDSWNCVLVAVKSFGLFFVVTYLSAVKLVCFQTFLIDGRQKGAPFL